MLWNIITKKKKKNPTYTDYRCGAYAIAYWKWKEDEEQGIPYNYSKDQADNYVKGIYDRIRFNAEDVKHLMQFKIPEITSNQLSNYSSPNKICVDLDALNIRREQGTRAIIYTSRPQIFYWLGLHGNITKIDKIDDLKTGEKAILLMGKANGFPRHYIFAYGSNELDAEGHVIMHIIDPTNGIDVGTGGNIRNWVGNTSYNFLNTIIKFGHEI
ncbi:MAG: hypothetical protein IJM23_08525 [Lachnospiraceae bacterium]|nr:hypothetical protein [Lachnospiraceae bacterium]